MDLTKSVHNLRPCWLRQLVARVVVPLAVPVVLLAYLLALVVQVLLVAVLQAPAVARRSWQAVRLLVRACLERLRLLA